MKIKALILALAVVLCVPLAMAQAPHMGTWKLNEGRSKLPSGMAKISTVVVQPDGDNIKVTQEGTDREGKSFHSEWVGKFDGKQYPIMGGMAETRSYTMVNDHTLTAVNKKDGKTVVTARVMVSPDSKTRTTHATVSEATGQPRSYTTVYEKH